MEKFDQPELHPRGFPLWLNILLVGALILTPLVVVALYQAWQDHQAGIHRVPIKQTTVTETESKTETPPATDTPAETKTEESKTEETKTDAH